MNERIRELAEQAGIKITPMIIDGIEYEYEDVDMDGSEDLAKFAELIVRECMKMCDEVHRDYGMASDTARISKRYIKKHFGVEP